MCVMMAKIVRNWNTQLRIQNLKAVHSENKSYKNLQSKYNIAF